MKKQFQQQQDMLHMLNVAKNPRPRIVKQEPQPELSQEPINEEPIIEDIIEEEKSIEIKENKKNKNE